MTTFRGFASRSATLLELEHATKPFSSFEFASRGIRIIDWLNQLIAQSLMISF
jgi:hypothetical protein